MEVQQLMESKRTLSKIIENIKTTEMRRRTESRVVSDETLLLSMEGLKCCWIECEMRDLGNGADIKREVYLEMERET